MSEIERLNFLSPEEVQAVASAWGTPTYVYDEATMQAQADKALAVDAPYGLTVRYAMKTSPNSHILRAVDGMGLHIDASSGPEAERAIRAGIDPTHVLLTTQEVPGNLAELVEQGIEFNACSLNQLDTYGRQFPGSETAIRPNPGKGSGHDHKTNVGGPSSSFGIWHEYMDEARAIAEKHDLKITRLHTHIGSGSDPKVWAEVARMSLQQVHDFPDVRTLNLGGGFNVGRMRDEKAKVPDDLNAVSEVVSEELQRFRDETGRELRLEIEPGTFMMANAGSLITTIHDIVDTGKDGYTFLKMDAGMTELIRTILYAAQHPMIVVREGRGGLAKYIAAGHCCESGDMHMPDPDDPKLLKARLMEEARIGDRMVIEGVGSYAAAMSTLNYNSFPIAPEVFRRAGSNVMQLIRRRQTLEEMLQLETPFDEQVNISNAQS